MSQILTLRTETGDEDIDFSEFEFRVRRGEVAPQSLVRFPPLTGEHFVQACTLDAYKALHRPEHSHFLRAFSLSQFPYLTAIVIVVNVAVYAWSLRLGELDIDALVRMGGKVEPMILDLGEFWRLLTANFLHRDGLHIGLNMFVLLNVGRALENAYHRWHYLALLLFSGICAMAASLWLTDAVTLGASGMVYGGLGAVVVFGLRFRHILPSRYRRVLAEAAMPTVVGLLLMGILPSPGGGSSQVDTWAHLGGLVGGAGWAVFLKPRLLSTKGTQPSSLWRHFSPLAILLGGLVLLHVWVQGQVPLWTTNEDDELGLRVQVPGDWKPVANRFGQFSFYNGLQGVGRALFAVDVIDFESAEMAAQHFLENVLTPSSLGSDVLRVEHETPVRTLIAGMEAWLIKARIEESWGATWMNAYFVNRGMDTFQIVWTHSEEFPKYEKLFKNMLYSVKFLEPKGLRQARAKVMLFPFEPSAMGDLGLKLNRVGEWKLAAEILQMAVERTNQPSQVHLALSQALLQLGRIEEGCQVAYSVKSRERFSRESIEASVRCELFRNQPENALQLIREAKESSPLDEEWRTMEKRLLQWQTQGSKPKG